MAYDFEPDEEYQKELDWVDQFVREELEPLDDTDANAKRRRR